jgi:hypothetical protein
VSCTAPAVKVSAAQREALATCSPSHMPHRLVQRARIVVLAAEAVVNGDMPSLGLAEVSGTGACLMHHQTFSRMGCSPW